MDYVVYAIGITEDLMPPYDKCYIGVTNKPKNRWNVHYKSDYTVGKFIREHNLTYENNMIIIFNGTSNECFTKENEMRPVEFIGLNEAPGGCGGKTVYNKARNEKISKALKGRKITWMSKIIESRGDYNGNKNPRAKKWLIINPSGKKYNVHGNLQQFCKENNISSVVLYNNKGTVVPPPKYGGYGGYRPKDEKSKIKRENTSGWMLVDYKEK
jgi:hypothetical protein